MTKLQQVAANIVEGCWLTAIAVVPSLFFVRAPLLRMFEPAKASVVRCLAVVALGALLFLVLGASRRQIFALTASRWRTAVIASMLAIVGSFTLSNIFSVAPQISFWGEYQRRQGTFTECSYIVLFIAVILLLRRQRQIDLLISASLMGSVSPAIYSCWQAWQIDPLPWGHLDRTFGTAGNPIVLAAFLIMVWPLTLARVLANMPQSTEKFFRSVAAIRFAVYVGLLIVQSLAILYTESRGPVVGLCAGMTCFGLLSLRPSRVHGVNRTPLVLGLLVVGLTVLLVTMSVLSALRSDRVSTVSVRTVIWRSVLAVVAEHPVRVLAGYGPETLTLAIQRHYPVEIEHLEPRTDVRIDRSHNATLDSVLTRGVIGAAAEICLIVSMVVMTIRYLRLERERRIVDSNRLFLCALISAICAHFVEIQFFTPVTSTRLLFWIYAGASVAIIGGIEPSRRTESPPFFATDASRLTLILALMLAVFTFEFYTGIVQPHRALGLLATVWLVVALLIAVHPPDTGTEPNTSGVWRSFIVCVAMSAAAWLTFSLGYIWCLERASQALELAPADVTVGKTGDAVIIVFGFSLLVIVISALCAYREVSHGGRGRRRGSWSTVFGAAVAACVTLIATLPNVRESRAAMIAGVGRSKELGRDWPAAADCYQAAAELQPDDAEYAVDAGRMLMEAARAEASQSEREGRVRTSLRAFENAHLRNPSDGRYVRLLALMHRQSAQIVSPQDQKPHLDESNRLYREAVAIIPRSASLWQEWGSLAAELGDYELALQRFTNSIRLNDRLPETFSHRAQVEDQLGLHDQATEDTLRARALSSESLKN